MKLTTTYSALIRRDIPAASRFIKIISPIVRSCILMPRWRPLLMVLFIGFLTLQGSAQEKDKHFNEAGSGVLFSRSAFAHGYRHGYEEGYHAGNIEINMGRTARPKKVLLRGLKYGYSSGFGPRRSFEAGFEAGMLAGYSDGYAGRPFRAIEAVRAVASTLEGVPLPADSANLSFDQGLAFGYREGFESGDLLSAFATPLDSRTPGCGQVSLHAGRDQDFAAQGSYCDGYRRGFFLGHADARAQGAERPALEATK